MGKKDYEARLRNFEFNYKGLKFKCNFGRSTDTLKKIALSTYEISPLTNSNWRNLRHYREFYLKTDFYEKLVKDAIPTSFFIKGPINQISDNYTLFAKVFNFYQTYFDRDAPTIMIIQQQLEQPDFDIPCYSKNNNLPKVVNATEIDPILVDIFEVANETKDIRLKFIFYYQILEYSSYYHLNVELKSKLSKILQHPEVSYKSNEYSKLIIDELKNHFSQRDDSKKIEYTITDFCEVEDIKPELQCNIDYFTQDVKFDGGLVIDKIFIDKIDIDHIGKSHLIQIKQNIDKIRNVLVHLRESRENKVILPTKKNDSLLRPYLYVLRRISEMVAIHYS